VLEPGGLEIEEGSLESGLKGRVRVHALGDELQVMVDPVFPEPGVKEANEVPGLGIGQGRVHLVLGKPSLQVAKNDEAAGKSDGEKAFSPGVERLCGKVHGQAFVKPGRGPTPAQPAVKQHVA
jgi:hypothetical protein